MCLYRESDNPVLSCELHPPRSPSARQRLREQLPLLLKLPFQLYTCTHGAGGSVLEGTTETLQELRTKTPRALAAHLCCLGVGEQDLVEQLGRIQQLGINGIMALRGDRGPDPSAEDGYSYAIQLVQLIKREYPDFLVAVAGYPEGHPEAPDLKTDIQFLKEKVEAGADVVMTQFFFENEPFFRFLQSCREAGITAPIVPGVLPVTTLKKVESLSRRCQANVPNSLRNYLAQYEDQEAAGLEFSLKQITGLLEAGVPGLHFYCLNKAEPVGTLLEKLRSTGLLVF